MEQFIKYLFLYGTGHTYSNLSRLFIRLFVGVMFLQFGIRQVMHFDTLSQTFPTALGLGSYDTLILMIAVEMICSVMIMLGFLTRIMTIPPIISMLIAENVIFNDIIHQLPYTLGSIQPGYLPIMFIGIFFFILLSGPGKISVDYLISLHFLNYSNDKSEEDALKEA
ncbi:MAG: DoxX family protein [Muribaculaceae bacterium]